jgi:hypothetical protein
MATPGSQAPRPRGATRASSKAGRRRRRRPNPPLAVRKRRRARQRQDRRPRQWWNYAALELDAIEAGLPPEYANFTKRVIGKSLIYNGTVTVPEIGVRRHLAIVLRGPPSRVRPLVFADGPRRSRHRFRWSRPSSLCIWFGPDHETLRWTPRHGLVGLIDLARRHLLQEYWWRAESVWDAPEIHAEPRGSEHRSTRPPRGSGSRWRERRERCWCGRRRYCRCHGAIDAKAELNALGLRP